MYIARLSVDHNKLKLCWPQKVRESEVFEVLRTRCLVCLEMGQTLHSMRVPATSPGEKCVTVRDSDLLPPDQCFRMLLTDKFFRGTVKILFHHRMPNLYGQFLHHQPISCISQYLTAVNTLALNLETLWLL